MPNTAGIQLFQCRENVFKNENSIIGARAEGRREGERLGSGRDRVRERRSVHWAPDSFCTYYLIPAANPEFQVLEPVILCLKLALGLCSMA